eukprot:GDKH01000491.1.p1 GENE.GDKH01000491.1~~GDKH01000491.1.p1  ORF type:complete len:348 (-),score=28.80 GDKH01000491.1:125-1168(-)
MASHRLEREAQVPLWSLGECSAAHLSSDVKIPLWPRVMMHLSSDDILLTASRVNTTLENFAVSLLCTACNGWTDGEISVANATLAEWRRGKEGGPYMEATLSSRAAVQKLKILSRRAREEGKALDAAAVRLAFTKTMQNTRRQVVPCRPNGCLIGQTWFDRFVGYFGNMEGFMLGYGSGSCSRVWLSPFGGKSDQPSGLEPVDANAAEAGDTESDEDSDSNAQSRSGKKDFSSSLVEIGGAMCGTDSLTYYFVCCDKSSQHYGRFAEYCHSAGEHGWTRRAATYHGLLTVLAERVSKFDQATLDAAGGDDQEVGDELYQVACSYLQADTWWSQQLLPERHFFPLRRR